MFSELKFCSTQTVVEIHNRQPIMNVSTFTKSLTCFRLDYMFFPIRILEVSKKIYKIISVIKILLEIQV